MASSEQRRTWRQVVALPLAVLALLPLALMIGGSLRPVGPPAVTLADLVEWPPAAANYPQAIELAGMGRMLLNSTIVAVASVPLSVVVASFAGFSISRIRGRFGALLLAVSFAALMVPVTALLVGRFSLFSSLGLTDSYVPLIAPALIGMSPLYVLLYYAAFRRLPSGLLDAARLDGCTPFRTWLHVAMPLVWPVTVAVATLAFATSWGSFLEPLVYLFDPELYTVPLGLRNLALLDPARTPLLLAAAVIATIPAIGAFLVAQRALFREIGL